MLGKMSSLTEVVKMLKANEVCVMERCLSTYARINLDYELCNHRIYTGKDSTLGDCLVVW